MREIKCKCGMPCKNKIGISGTEEHIEVWITHQKYREGKDEMLMYLDANEAINFIRGLKEAIKELQ